MMPWQRLAQPAVLRTGTVARLLGCLLLCCAAVPAWAADDDEPEFLPGLIATYTGSDGRAHTRLDAQVAFVWDDRSPDLRVPPGPFQSEWRGQVFCQVASKYTFRVYAQGHVQLALDGQVVLEGDAAEPQWLKSKPVTWEFGQHPLALSYRKTGAAARVGLYWTGPQFQTEPVAERWLTHLPKETPGSRFEQGQLLVHALRCAACHDLPGAPAPLPAPALEKLSRNLSSQWLQHWLSPPSAPVQAGAAEDTATADDHLGRRMPDFGFAPAEARDLATWLLTTSQGAGPSNGPSTALPDRPLTAAGTTDAAAGAVLFGTVGCLACHRVGELGASGLFGGGDLTQIAAKRPAEFFERWLAHPAAINRHHRMPVFRLDEAERKNLGAYLSTLKPAAKEAEQPSDVAPSPQRVEKLLEARRCSACHLLPGSAGAIGTGLNGATKRNHILPARRIWDQSCLGEPDPARQRPGYRLSESQRKAIITFVDALPAARRTVSDSLTNHAQADGALVLAERNCLACHARGLAPGIAPRALETVEARPELRDRLGGMSPPALNAVGDKLQDAALAEAITTQVGSRRPWLSIRMPRFPLSAAELAALSKTLIDTDRIPDLPVEPVAKPASPDDPIKDRIAGARLVTAEGFGCTSCHQIGKWEPQKVALNAHGPDLVMLGSRLRRPWYDRWVRNPARIVPRMEMPAVQIPIKNVLKNNVDAQLAAVWLALNEPGFNPPRPDALRVVRAVPGDERANVLTDNIEIDKQPILRPIVIGLPNRHNALFDLTTGRLSHWWIGDTASQRTRGKSWYWEAAGTQLLPAAKKDAAAEPELSLWIDGKPCERIAAGQYAREFTYFRHQDQGLEFGQRLQFESARGPVTVRVFQVFAPWPQPPNSRTTGFTRTIEIEEAPAGSEVRLLGLAPADATLPRNGRSFRIDGPGGEGRIEVSPTAEPLGYLLTYLTELPIEASQPVANVDRSSTKVALDVVPGFEAVRLPVTDEAMPTGLAWREDGTLVISSLEGRLWLGRDTDGDGLEDRLTPFSDNLAAPYGVATSGPAIDVINKYGLLRLYDVHDDGRADLTQMLASGWGYTLDYHDWAVGLPSDERGNYYVALPCQQDDRSETAANLRGWVIQLKPQQPTPEDPRPYAIEPIAGGLRFPMGLARSRGGKLFATDNQGNYTPFNELNHIRPGVRFGFINRLESKRGLNPPFVPAAIEIPHPWTRSVNGICFLDTPADLQKKVGGPRFGPFEGHLLGCEFDSRRLVRMSLEQVAGVYQGAVYPLSAEPAPGAETFEGPVVCAVAPDGDIYIGNLRDSGWGAGANTGSLVRLRWLDQLPTGIAEVRAAPGGFTITFTGEVDPALAADPVNYAISSLRRIPTPAYGGPDQDRRVDKVKSVAVSADRRHVTLALDNLREGFVYEFRLRSLVRGAKFFPDEAYYTLRKLAPETR